MPRSRSDSSSKRPGGEATADERPSAEHASFGRGFGSSAVYDRLHQEILTLALSPGTLLDETEIAARFGLSRSPVREALVRLAAEGLVVTLRNRSSIVAPFDISAIPAYLDATRLMYRLTAKLAAMNRTSAQLAQIRHLQKVHLMALEQGDLERIVSANREFHIQIAEASANPHFLQWTRSLLNQGQRILAAYLYDLDCLLPEDSLDGHRQLVEAIADRDADGAEAAGALDADILANQLNQRIQTRRLADFSLPAQPPVAGAPALVSRAKPKR